MKTIYMDITSLLVFPTMTGIQRVVSEIAVHLAASQESNGYRLVLLRHNRDYNFTVCDNDKFMLYFMLSKGKKSDCVTSYTITIDQMAPSSFWLDVDCVWVSMIPRHILYPQLAKRNIQIGVYVHDVITITHPQYCAADNQMRFPAYLGAVYDYANYIFTQTKYTRDQIQKLAKEVGCDREIQYTLAPPGGNFLENAAESTSISDDVREIAERGKILLTVSTLEIRKNHKVLLDAFDAELCKMGYQMVFVGKAGWKVDDLLERIESHPENGKSLFHLKGLNDDTLRFLYQNASFVLFPSYIEGYGLATVEAMQYGVPTILSDVPIMREVGGDYCDYFNPDTPEQLIETIRRYEMDPALYAKKKEKLKSYHAPTWDACAKSIADSILQFRKPPELSHQVEQIVYLSARPDAMLHTLEYVEHFMPFIKKVLILCPDAMAHEMGQLYQGGLEAMYISDSELLKGRALPADHLHRNFLLRCLAMRRPELDDEFIMSDDDYRPLKEVDLSFFVRDDRYQAFYFYDLDQWADVVREPTSYDLAMLRTNEFLKQNGYPNLQYASHMPQIIHKKWYLDMLRVHPGLEETGCCEWSTYFNYSVSHYPESFDVRPYTVMSWPEMITSWHPMVEPTEYVFENFYEFLYEKGRPFSGMSTTYQETAYLDNAKKALINDLILQKAASTRKRWRTFENKCNVGWKQFPSFVFCFGKNMKPAFLNPPIYLELLNSTAYNFPVFLMEKDELGQWKCSDANLRLGYCWTESSTLIISQNVNGRGKVAVKIGTPGNVTSTYLKLFYSFDNGKFIAAGKIPVYLSNSGRSSDVSAIVKNDSKMTKDVLPSPAQLSESLNYVNTNFEVPYYQDLRSRGLKNFVKKIVRKIIKCIVAPIVEMQNRFNKKVAFCLNCLSASANENSLETELCRQELDAWYEEAEVQNKQTSKMLSEQSIQLQSAQEEIAQLYQRMENLEKTIHICISSEKGYFLSQAEEAGAVSASHTKED